MKRDLGSLTILLGMMVAGCGTVLDAPQATVKVLNPARSATLDAPQASDATRGTSAQGSYMGVPLPAGWEKLRDEAAVTAEIDRLSKASATSPAGNEAFLQFCRQYKLAFDVCQTRRLFNAPPLDPARCVGTLAQGRFVGILLPEGWDRLSDEAAVMDEAAKIHAASGNTKKNFFCNFPAAFFLSRK